MARFLLSLFKSLNWLKYLPWSKVAYDIFLQAVYVFPFCIFTVSKKLFNLMIFDILLTGSGKCRWHEIDYDSPDVHHHDVAWREDRLHGHGQGWHWCLHGEFCSIKSFAFVFKVKAQIWRHFFHLFFIFLEKKLKFIFI